MVDELAPVLPLAAVSLPPPPPPPPPPALPVRDGDHGGEQHGDSASSSGGEEEPPTSLAGSFRKFSTGAINRWSIRHFVLVDGWLFWSKETLPCELPSLIKDSSCIDLSRTPCEVIATEGKPGHLQLVPVGRRRWSRLDLNSRAGSKEALLLDVGERHEEWVDVLRQHISFARDRAAERERQADVRMGLSVVEEDELVAARECQQECPVCLEALVKQQPVLRTPCNHFLHQECLKQWLRKAPKKPSCPSCRTEFCRHRHQH
mmetsp:Transcript_118281/g.297463  ORF Transcript_118281/g.297463 Transcript_118281/m.297463 type:complete len:261 (+) Transcript_118281:74-856(+)